MPYDKEWIWDREQYFRDTAYETWVPKEDAERKVQEERDRNTVIGASLRNANSNAEILAARIRVLEGEKQALEARIVAGARREASLGVDAEDAYNEIKRLRETQIPTLNTIQKARYKHGTNFDRALGLKGDESLEVVIPRVIDEFMVLKPKSDMSEEGWRLYQGHAATLDRIRARCDKAYAGTGLFSAEKCVNNLATAFEAMKVRLGTAIDALQQVQIATQPQPKLYGADFKIKWNPPLGYPGYGYPAYLFSGV